MSDGMNSLEEGAGGGGGGGKGTKQPARRNATRSMQIGAGLVDALAALAERKRDSGSLDGSRGPRVTIRALVEEAVLDKWPELRAAAVVINDPAAAGATDAEQAEAGEQLWNVVLRAVYASGEPAEQAAAIDMLEGSIIGNFGERLGLKELAYHLRGSVATVGSMAELVRDFEQMGR